MDTKRYFEYFLCDAMRLAQLLGGDGATLSAGIGNADDFPLAPKAREQVNDDIRFLRVDGNDYYEIAFLSTRNPTADDAKIRNKSYHRVAIGMEIRKAREETGLTIEELSKRTNLRPYSLIRIEEGRWDLDISLLGVILDALNKTIKLL